MPAQDGESLFLQHVCKADTCKSNEGVLKVKKDEDSWKNYIQTKLANFVIIDKNRNKKKLTIDQSLKKSAEWNNMRLDFKYTREKAKFKNVQCQVMLEDQVITSVVGKYHSLAKRNASKEALKILKAQNVGSNQSEDCRQKGLDIQEVTQYIKVDQKGSHIQEVMQNIKVDQKGSHIQEVMQKKPQKREGGAIEVGSNQSIDFGQKGLDIQEVTENIKLKVPRSKRRLKRGATQARNVGSHQSEDFDKKALDIQEITENVKVKKPRSKRRLKGGFFGFWNLRSIQCEKAKIRKRWAKKKLKDEAIQALIFDSNTSRTACIYEQIPDSNIGKKMLKKMGWTGGGLGKLEQAMKEPLKVKASNYSKPGLKHASKKFKWRK